MFLAEIKNYGCATIIICLLTITCIFGWQLHSAETEHKEYKDSINDQLSKAKIEKSRIEAEQQAKLDKASNDYAADRNRLADIIRRMRESGAMPREASVRVAGSGASSLPGEAEDTARTLKDSAATARTGCAAFYSEAMMDTLQCSRLIQFVKD
jgi:hypothetical protein